MSVTMTGEKKTDRDTNRLGEIFSTRNIIIFGAPGAGKGTIANQLDFRQLSTGDIFKSTLKDPENSVGVKARSFIESGKLVPDEVVFEILEQDLAANGTRGVLFDGFPRTLGQAKILADRGVIDRAYFLNIPYETVAYRVLNRLTCSRCSASFHKQTRKPIQSGVCDYCKGSLETRKDDNIETLKTRFDTFSDETVPAIDFIKTKIPVMEIDATLDLNDKVNIILDDLMN